MADLPTPRQQVQVNIAPGTGEASKKEYYQPEQKFLPKEAYALMGQLIKVDDRFGKIIVRLLLGHEVIDDEDSPTGYRLRKMDKVTPFCNEDGFEKIADFLLLHLSVPLSYMESEHSPMAHAAEISMQLIKDIAANFEQWEVSNPSLIPQLASAAYSFIIAVQGQHTELLEDMTGGGLLNKPKEPEPVIQQRRGRFGV